MKIALLGFSASGKSTLAKWLAQTYQLPLLHLDTIQFTANWQDRPLEEGQAMVKEFMSQDSWVIDGNYRKFFQAERLEEADMIIFMNFPVYRALPRAIKRYISFHGKTRSDMADDCIEKLDWTFMKWILKDGRTPMIKDHYKSLQQTYPEKWIELTSQKDINAFMTQIEQKENG
ncbi:DNA topology modulation protein [Granulicatella seriolae]|uniref:DNA topology modulation protein n=1 Tax=Granulicatella seriolae TaxID=2967226 RepID=A0ABT1WLV5_9LACT|nr:DNA topology modulation protein [Granulicatella seriolae]